MNPTYVPISPITRGSRRKLPLRMTWGLTIHKAQAITLQNVTIDIGNTNRQNITFTVQIVVEASHCFLYKCTVFILSLVDIKDLLFFKKHPIKFEIIAF